MFETSFTVRRRDPAVRALIGGVMVSTCLVNVEQRAEDSGASLKNWKCLVANTDMALAA